MSVLQYILLQFMQKRAKLKFFPFVVAIKKILKLVLMWNKFSCGKIIYQLAKISLVQKSSNKLRWLWKILEYLWKTKK